MTGSGTQDDPYVIYDATDLQNMALDLSACYELANNIDASGTSGWNLGAGFDPVGENTNEFSGNFDGKGYIISDLFINRPTEWYVGLFGKTLIHNPGTYIRNVGLTDVDITGAEYANGSLIGFHDGDAQDISDCYTTGVVETSANGPQLHGGFMGYNGSSITDCYTTCDVTATPTGPNTVWECGGFTGLNDGDLTRCYATGDVTATCGDASEVGGFSGGVDNGTISQCFATGNVSVAVTGGDAQYVAGFIGDNSSLHTLNCYARGNVTVTATGTIDCVGGFIGYNFCFTNPVDNCYSTGAVSATGTNIGGFCGENDSTISNCFWDTQTSGQSSSDGGTGKTTAQMKTKSTFTDAGWDFVDL